MVWMGIFVGITVALGQVCFALLVRGLNPENGIVSLLWQAILSPWLYAAGFTYLLGIFCYGLLLRTATLITANILVIVVVVVANAAFSMMLGERPSATQIAGILLAVSGVALLRS